MKRAAWLFVVLMLAGRPAFAQNGVLKVTSFPSGAQVLVDGISTGKVTPMSVALSVGDHQVSVRIPDSSWRPETRTVGIVLGTNEMNVTLLPELTTGPQGPAGPRGPSGPPSLEGLAGQMCPAGQFVRGFDQSGRIVCADMPSGGGTPGGLSMPELASDIAAWLTGLRGDEWAGTYPFSAGGVTGHIDVLGFALCLPPDLNAGPQLDPPFYGCTPAPQVSAVKSSDGKTVAMTISLGSLFLDYGGGVSYGPLSASLDGYILLTGVQLNAVAPLVDQGDGTVKVGPLSQFTITYADSEIETGSSLLSFVANTVFSQAFGVMRDALRGALDAYLSTL